MRDKITPYAADSAEKAADLLRAGGLVAIPTETVYGLAADATNDLAVAKIFEAKQRPSFNPLIIHVSDLAMARGFADVLPLAAKLAEAFWPGPLTLVLPRKLGTKLSHLVSAGLETVAIRCPAAEPAQAILGKFGRPFAAPSANQSGSISPTLATHVAVSLGDAVEMILDNGPCPVGVESTILKVTENGAALLRPGGLPVEEILSVSGPLVEAQAGSMPQAPGMLARHYAPTATLQLNVRKPQVGAAYLGFGSYTQRGPLFRNLSPAADLREAAANLFRYIHELDVLADRINVAPIPKEGLGLAINDRLRRAAAPRE